MGKILRKRTAMLLTAAMLAAVMPFKSQEWEMLNTYYMLLVHKLPVLKGEDFTEGRSTAWQTVEFIDSLIQCAIDGHTLKQKVG